MGWRDAEDWRDEDDWALDEFESDEDIDSECLDGVSVVRTTDKAVLISHRGNVAWFPISVLTHQEEGYIEFKHWFNPEWKPSKTRTSMKAIEGDFI